MVDAAPGGRPRARVVLVCACSIGSRMRGKSLRRRLPAAGVLVLYWFCLTASVAAPLTDHNLAAGRPSTWAAAVTAAPVRCVGTLARVQAHWLRLGGWPKVVIALDVTRADRCAAAFGQPVGRLHAYFVLTRDKLAVRTHLRANSNSPWMRACRLIRPECLEVNTVIRWIGPAGSP